MWIKRENLCFDSLCPYTPAGYCFGDSPLNAYVVQRPARKEQREQRGVRARADWLLRYLRSVTADGGIPPPQTPPSNCDCSRCEHRSSVWVGVSKALDRLVASLMVDLFSLMSSGDLKAQIRFKSLQNLIWSDHRDIGHLESRHPREKGGCLCACFLTCCLLLTTCSDLDAGMCLQLCIITCNKISCVLKFIKNVYWKCNVIFRLQITKASGRIICHSV